MKLKPFLSIAAGCALLLSTASGCSFSDFGTEGMLRPPKTMGDEAEIESIISSSAPNGYTLKYPKNGAYRSAIIMNDIDGDETDEAIAFFKEKGDATGVHMLVMYESENGWKLSADYIAETTDVDRVDFADIDDGGSLEILVGYATYATNISSLSCYTYSNGKTSEIKSGQTYSEFYCGNLNSDGKSEVITLTLYSAEAEAKASMLTFDKKKNSLFIKASVNMDPNVIKYKNVLYSDIGEGCKGVVIDGELSSGELVTQVIYFNNELSLLRNPLYKEKSDNITRRSSPVISADTDNDQIIDIPTVSNLPSSGLDRELNIPDILSWNNLSVKSELLTVKYNTVADYAMNYTLKMPDKWQNNTVTAVSNDDGTLTELYEYKNKSLGNKLFEIKVFEISRWDLGQDIEGYSLIYKDNRYAYAFKNIDVKSQYSLTDDEIKTAFSVLNELSV